MASAAETGEAPTEVDAVVIGGGPAGLSTAETVARAGWRTLVVEREPEIGDPVRTSGATSIQTVRRFSIPRELYHPLRRLRFRSPNNEAVFDYAEDVLAILDVRGTYRLLAERARAAGATIETGALASAPLLDGGAVTGCEVRNGVGSRQLRSRILVDAGGYKATMSKAAGLHPGYSRFGVGAEYDVVAPHCRQDEAVLVVGARYAPAGYAWAFPWGESRVRIGVGLHHADVRDDPRKLLDVFVAEAPALGIDVTDYEIRENHYGLVPADGLPARFSGDGIVAVGDAACQATLVVGEGIRTSILAGRLAGDVVARALADGRADRAALVPYERAFRDEFARSLSIGAHINRRMARFDDAEWDEKTGLLQTIPASVVLSVLQSRFSAPELLVAFARHPRFWPRLVRYGLRAVATRLGASST